MRRVVKQKIPDAKADCGFIAPRTAGLRAAAVSSTLRERQWQS
jgi:hypothetical protein